jgi:hypothetical protein
VRKHLWIPFSVFACAALSEAVSRWGLGLGDPPLSYADPQIEYLFRPDQDVRRFGRRVRYNAYSMRSDGFPPHKSDRAELRALVLGDSVVNGGSLTDQADLATSIAATKAREALRRPVMVGNISAGSWGPPNLLAYAKRFGFFDADLVVVVLSSHDCWDVPTFQPVVDVDPAFPGHHPPSAVWEALTRYVIPRVRGRTATPAAPGRSEADKRAALASLRDVLAMARSSGARTALVLHRERGELGRATSAIEGFCEFDTLAKHEGVPTYDLGAVTPRETVACYRDEIHLNDRGQAVLASLLLRLILDDASGIEASRSPGL